MLTKGEKAFRCKYGHASLCNCMRKFRGKWIITRRKCTRGGWEKIKSNQIKQTLDPFPSPATGVKSQATVNHKGLNIRHCLCHS